MHIIIFAAAKIMFIAPNMPAAIPTHKLPTMAVGATQPKTVLILARRARIET